jgi:hypothetical protein
VEGVALDFLLQEAAKWALGSRNDLEPIIMADGKKKAAKKKANKKKVKRVSMTGSVAANLHEGSRSEYLAHFVFSSFGTAFPVPHQEDTGLDIYCTLLERVGQRAPDGVGRTEVRGLGRDN